MLFETSLYFLMAGSSATLEDEQQRGRGRIKVGSGIAGTLAESTC